MRREVAEAKLAALGAGRGAGAGDAGADERGRAERADDRARRPRRGARRAAATPSSRRPTSPRFAGARVAELDALRPSWDDLPPDAHLRDGGRYRRRRHASFVVDGGDVRLVPQRAHWQPIEYNALHGGLERWFEPIEAGVVAAPAWRGILRRLRRARVAR